MTAGAARQRTFAQATQAAQSLKEGAGDAKHRTQAFYDEYPLAAGAIGVAIGAIIGAAAPLSSRRARQSARRRRCGRESRG